MDQKSNDAAQVKFFPPGIPLIAIVAGLVLTNVWPLHFGVSVPASFRYALGGFIVISAILFLGGWSVVLFRSNGQSENPWKSTPCIETTGPFSVTRNPMYLQMVIVCIGTAILFGSWWILLLTPGVIWALQHLAIEPEEAYLESKFGDTYLDYKRRVRRWIEWHE